MEVERGRTRVYRCPRCGVDTPHHLRARRNDTCAVVCANCGTGALVRFEELCRAQLRWEEGLRQILEEIRAPAPGGPEGPSREG